MAVVLGVLLIFLAIIGHSGATYCVCNSGSDSVLQKNIDYACGAGASCSPIQQNGACYNPNTVKDHCNYAVNSYFQNKGQATGSCDFSGTATTTQTIPSQSSTCVYPTSASSSSTPSTSTGTGTGTGTSTGTGIGTTIGTNTTTTTGFPPSTPFVSGPDSSRAPSLSLHQISPIFFWPFSLTLIFLRP